MFLILKNKKKTALFLSLFILLSAVIGYRIYSNIKANKERAVKASSQVLPTVQIAPVKRQDLEPRISIPASLEPLWQADLSPKVEGRLVRLTVNEGDSVEAGQIIAVVDPTDLPGQVSQAQGNLFSAQADYVQAQSDLKRYEALAQAGAISAQTLESARQKHDSLYGKVQAAQGNLDSLQNRLGQTEIRSPRDGVIVKRYMQEGSYAKVGSPIVTIADVSSVLAKASVGESQVVLLKEGAVAQLKLDALPDQAFSGILTRLSPMAALPSRSFTAEVTVPNAGRILRPGMFATVELPSQVKQQVIVVPLNSLVMREDQKTVFVLLADGKVQQRLVQVGYSGDGLAEILSGLNENEQIVVTGMQKLRDGMSVETYEAGGTT